MNAEKLETEIARALRDNQDALALQLIQLRERLVQPSTTRPLHRPHPDSRERR